MWHIELVKNKYESLEDLYSLLQYVFTMSAYEVRKMTQQLEYGTARIAYSSAYTNQAISQAQNLHEETQTLLDDFNRKKR